MLSSLRILFLTLFLIAFSQISSRAQERDFLFTASAGVSIPILDNGYGTYLALNPAFRLTQRLYVEGQVSHIRTTVTSSFLSGEEGEDNAVNLLAGGRFYINPANENNRFYINLLIGANYLEEERENQPDQSEWQMGLSLGASYEFRRLVFGASLEAPNFVVLKIGVKI